MVFGLALVMALVLGATSVALAGNLDPLRIGSLKNVATKTTQLVGKVATGSAFVVKNPSGGSALDLQVNADQAPLTVNADAGTATNLSADELDGKDSIEIGVNGLQRVSAFGPFDSTSPKTTIASCPSGKVLVGTGFDISGGKTGSSPDTLANVVIDQVEPAFSTNSLIVEAYEEEATTSNWAVDAYAICAKAP